VDVGGTGNAGKVVGRTGTRPGSAGTAAGTGTAVLVDCIDDSASCIDEKTALVWSAPAAMADWVAVTDKSAATAAPPKRRLDKTPGTRPIPNVLNMSPTSPHTSFHFIAAYLNTASFPIPG